MDELQQQIDDINDNLGDYSVSDTLDDLTDSQDGQEDTNNDFENRVESLEANIGQLTFPLTQDTIDLIKEQFSFGFVTLVAGGATVKDNRVSTNSVILLTCQIVSGTQGILSYNTVTAGQINIFSSNSLDTSTVSYLILS